MFPRVLPLALAASCAAALFSASYRKDAWLPRYDELGVPLPLEGGRVHVVGVASRAGVPHTIVLNGSALDLSSGLPQSAWLVDWARAEPAAGVAAGAPVWVSFHSRRPAWDAAAASHVPVPLAVLDATGAELFAGSFAIGAPAAAVTWVTTFGDRAELLLYVRGGSGGDLALSRLLVNGLDVTAAVPPVARALPRDELVLWRLPAAAVGGVPALARGAVWTVEASWAGVPAPTSAGGMLWDEFYPLEAWPFGSDCPFPTLNDAAYAKHRATGVDTFFTERLLDAACRTELTAADVVNVLAPEYGFHVLPSVEDPTILDEVTDATGLAGWFLADEDDTVVDDKARALLAAVALVRSKWPAVPTYSGGASNRYTGAYAGITDVKGMDAYIGACAPHYMTLAPPVRYSYDYLANTRANHAPGPTWLYSQGFEDGWDSLGGAVNRQASASEIAVQVASVAAAGAKGLMLFETQLKYSVGESAPAWATLATLLRETALLREWYRAGDPLGSARALDATGAPLVDVLVEATLSPLGVVVNVINTATAGNPDCLIVCALGAPCHFTFVPVRINTLSVVLPAGVVATRAVEVFNGTLLHGDVPLVVGPGRAVSFAGGVQLGVHGPGTPQAAGPVDAIVRTFLIYITGVVGAAPDVGTAPVVSAAAPGASVPAPAASAAASAAALPPTLPTNASNASVWRTSRNSTERLTPLAPLPWTFPGPAPAPPAGANATRVSVNASATYQTIFGFGGAITESAVHVFGQLDAAAQAALLADLYGENADGTSLRYTTGRLTIGSCDFSLGYYSYNDKANDTAMSNFTIAHDEAALIPFILAAQAAATAQGRPLRFVSSPWSPPAWMKTNRQMSCFPLGPLDCALIPETQPAYALYLSKYLSAFKAAGVDIYAITVQNEPQPQTGTLTYEGMWFPFTAELEFVAEYLGPQLRADHPDVRIFVFDHNQADAYWYAAPILADPVASQYVDGVAYHWYSGPDWSALDLLHAEFPGKLLLASEATVGREDRSDFFKPPSLVWDHGEYYGTFIINDLVHNSVGFLDWNILLDQHGGPDHGDPTGELCEGLIQCGSDAMLIADTTQSPPVVYKQAFYWYMGHVSRFVPPQSVRIGATLAREGASAATPILGAAFTTPSGATVLVLQNAQDTAELVAVDDPRVGSTGWVTLPPHAIVTLEYSV